MVVWDGTSQHGKPVPSGIYFYQVAAGERVVTDKMMLLK
jgi:hypothetical protein